MNSIREITERFRQAMDYAARKHAAQSRKASDIPYLAHLLAVCAIVMEHTTDEDVWIASLLHDAVEDQGGETTACEIDNLFGNRVAELVMGCSEVTEGEHGVRLPWMTRKQAYLDSLAHAEPDVLLISAADKLQNARSVLADWLRCGDDSYCKFTAGKRGTHWYYQEIVNRYRQTGKVPEGLLREVEETVARFAPVRVESHEIYP